MRVWVLLVLALSPTANHIQRLTPAARQVPLPLFPDYRVTRTFKGPPSPVDLKSDRLARLYRTRLRAAAQMGPNFANHYTLVSWGCGSSCQLWAVIDAQTGRVFPKLLQSTAGAEFYPDSRLLILDSPRNVREMFNGQDPPADCAVCGTPAAFVWRTDHWQPFNPRDADRLRGE